jgi:hypothetical protein
METTTLESSHSEHDARRSDGGGGAPAGAHEPAPEQAGWHAGRAFDGAPGEPPGDGVTPLFSSPALSHAANNGARAVVLRRAQQVHGNRYVQRFLASARGHSAAPGPPVIQRSCACGGTCPKCRAEAAASGTENMAMSPEAPDEVRHIQAQAAHDSPPTMMDGGTAPPDLIPPGDGTPLDHGTRRFMESRIGTDLRDVRVHTDERAAASADAIGADAYATGRDIYFAAGRYAPSSVDGQRLLTHEITHTEQQAQAGLPSGRAAQGKITVGATDDPLEREAERLADGIVTPGRLLAAGVSADSAGSLRRAPDQAGGGGPAPMTTLSPTYAGAVKAGVSPLNERTSGIYLDIDGDQSADVIVKLSAAAKNAEGKITSLHVELTLISTGQVVARDFPVTIARAVVLLPAAGLRPTDGRSPAALTLGPGDSDSSLMIYPPRHEADGMIVQVSPVWGPALSGETFTSAANFVFKEPPKTGKATRSFTVFHPGTPRSLGAIWTLDFTAGAFEDPFRLTLLKENPDSTEVTVGIVPLVEGSPFSGSGFTYPKAPPRPLKLQVVAGRNTELALDLDGDGTADLRLYDQLSARGEEGKYDFGPPYDMARNREHSFRYYADSQSTWPEEGGTSARIANGQFSFYGTGGEASFQATSQATVIDSLGKQSRAASYLDQAVAIEKARLEIRKTASEASPPLIRKETFEAWKALSDGFDELQQALGASKAPELSQARQSRTKETVEDEIKRRVNLVSAAARTFAAQMTIEAPNELEPESTTDPESVTWFNPYTGQYYYRGFVSQISVGGTTGTRLADSLAKGQYDLAVRFYHELGDQLDNWIAHQYRAKGPSDREAAQKDPNVQKAASIESLVKRSQKLKLIAEFNPSPVRAVFHPLQRFEETHAIEEIPLSLFYWRKDGKWYLRDLTDPDREFTNHVDDKNETEPPHELFQELDRRAHFIKGVIYYQIPGGRTGRVLTTEKKELSDYFGYAAAALGIAAFVLATGGAGSVIVTACIVGASVAGATAAALDIKENVEQGNIDMGTIALDVVQIITSVAGGLGAVAREVKIAQVALAEARGSTLSPAAKYLATNWGGLARSFVPLTATAAAGDVVNLLAFTADVPDALNAIDKGPGDSGDRLRAKAMLLGRFAAQGALTVLSVRGSLSEIKSLGKIELGVTRGGQPIARVPAGVYNEADYQKELDRLLRGAAGELPKGKLPVDKPVKVRVLSGEEFEKLTSSLRGDAAVVIENGEPLVIVREGAVLSVIKEEALHVQQAFDPRLKRLFSTLEEAKLQNWETLALPDKLKAVRSKLQLELDAQRRIAEDLGKRASLSAEEYVQLDNAWQNIEHLRSKMTDWASLDAEFRTAKTVTGDPELLKDPARLFSKTTVASFDLLDTWRNMSSEEFLAAYKGRYPNTTLTDAELLERFAAGKRLNPDTWHLVGPTRTGKPKPDVEAEKIAGSERTFSTTGKSEPGTDPLKLEPKLAAERQKLIAERDAARAERDANLKKIPPDEVAAGKAGYKVNEASRQLGELHADAYMAQNHPEFKKVYPPAGAKSRSGDFDQVWVREKGVPGQKDYIFEQIVIEAKGGASELGSRMAGEIRAQQGTKEYFDSIVASMLKGTPEMQAIAARLREAGPEGIRYLHVQVPIESGVASSVSSVHVSEFDLAPKAKP